MPKIPKIKLAAEYLLKLADEYMAANPEEQAHEQGETPEQEVAEHAPGGYEENVAEEDEQALPVADDDAEIEKVLSDLSPEELDDLASQLAEDMQHPDEHQSDDTAALAQAIQEHLSQNPEAQAPDVSPEKAASLNLIKSAEYIEGFLNEAISHGATVKEAVDLYDSSLVDALSFAKIAEDKKKEIFETLLDNPQSIKEASFFEGFAAEAYSSGLNSTEAAELYKSSGLGSASFKEIGKKTMSIARRIKRKAAVGLKRTSSAISESARDAATKTTAGARIAAQDTKTLARRLKRKAAVGLKRSEPSLLQGLEREVKRRNAKSDALRNPFRPNISSPNSTQKTKTTQDASKVRGMREIKEDSKVKLASLAALRKLKGSSRIIQNIKAMLDEGKGVSHLFPGKGKISQNAFNKAVSEIERQMGSGASRVSRQAGNVRSKPTIQSFQDLGYDEGHALIDKALKRGKISPEVAEAQRQSLNERFFGPAGRSIPKPPKSAPPTADELVNQKALLDQQIAAGLHPEEAKQYLNPLVEQHISELKALKGTPFENIDHINTQLSKLVAADILPAERAQELHKALREHHLNIKPFNPQVTQRTSLERARAEAALKQELSNPATTADRKAQIIKEMENLAAERRAAAAAVPGVTEQGARAGFEPHTNPPLTELEKNLEQPFSQLQGRASELSERLKNMHQQLGTSEQDFAKHMSAIRNEQDLERQIAAAEKLLQTQAPRHEAAIIAANKGLDDSRKIRGASRSENNRLVRELNDGVDPKWSDTFYQALSGENVPRMSGIGHNVANRLGGAAKAVVDNPAVSIPVALGTGAAVASLGSAKSPEKLPERYNYPARRMASKQQQSPSQQLRFDSSAANLPLNQPLQGLDSNYA